MKKILLATRPLAPPWDETSKYLGYYLARTLTEHEITLLTAKGTALTGLPASVREEALFEKPAWNLREKIAFLKYLRDQRSTFDLVHYLFSPTKLNTTLLRQFALPTANSTKTVQTLTSLRSDIYDDDELRSLLFADHIVVCSDASHKRLTALGYQNVDRIYTGIDLALFAPGPRDDQLLAAFGFGRDKFLVVYPGEYSRLGATDMLVEGLLNHFEREPQSSLRFVFACRIRSTADQKKKAKIREIFAETGLLSKVAFTDTLYDMPALYNTADVIVFPVDNIRGKHDIPLVVIEAYGCAKTVILSDLPQFSEFSAHAVTVRKGDGDELFSRLSACRDNPEHFAALGPAARKFAEQSFDIRATARAYAALYTTLTGSTV